MCVEVNRARLAQPRRHRSEEHTSELQSPCNLVCRLLLEKKKLMELSTPKPASSHPSRHPLPCRAPDPAPCRVLPTPPDPKSCPPPRRWPSTAPRARRTPP